MTPNNLPEGFKVKSGRFGGRFESRFGQVAIDPSVLRMPSAYGSVEQSKAITAEYEKHFRKMATRDRRETAIVGKAGRKAEPETLELYESHFVQGKPWEQCFQELWSAPGRKPPVGPERAKVKAHLRKRVTAYARSRRAANSEPATD